MSKSSYNLLVVDDEPEIREVIVDALESYELNIQQASSVSEARKVLKDSEIDIVFTDIKMPGESGIVLLDEISQEKPEFPVVLITAFLDKSKTIQEFKKGAFDILEKPFEEEQIQATIKRAINKICLIKNLEEAQKQLSHKDKLEAIGRLSAGVAHEVNTPLAVANGRTFLITKLIERNESQGEKCQRALRQLKEALEKISVIVDGLKSFSRAPEEGFEILNIHEQIEKCVDFLGSIYEKENFKVKMNFKASNSAVIGNAGKFQQILTNFLSNAKAATAERPEPTASIETENESQNFILKVSDNGCGIKKENMDKLFEAFFTTKPVGEGTGLGLSITSTIINEMKGKIKVESELEVGTTFIMNFPLAEPKIESEQSH